MSTDRSDPTLAYTLPFQITNTIHRKVQEELQPERDENKATAKGKIVVITGGGTGIGAAIARVWTRAGAEGIVITGRRKEKLDETIQALEALNTGSTRFLSLPTDISKTTSTENLFAEVNKFFGRAADVVFANAAVGPTSETAVPVAEYDAKDWWTTFEINVLGVHNTVTSWIRSQSDPKKPVGTIINVNTGMAGLTLPGYSAYSVSKLASHKYMEYVAAEYPSLRPFTLLPGIVATDMNAANGDGFEFYARDEGEQTGALGLYLASPRADYLINSLTSINWDIGELEAHKEKIEGGLLRNKWVAVLPASGGAGL